MFGRCHWFADAYTCEVTGFSNPGPEIKSFNGTHLTEKTDSNVQYLRINDQSIEVFPRNLQKHFPNLKFLTVARCGIKKISKEDFIGIRSLEAMDLAGNLLTSLPDNLFADMRKLRKIYFNGNKLEKLSSKLLKPIEGTLEDGNFRNNVRINSFFDKNTPGLNDLTKFKAIIDEKCLPPEPVIEEATACDCEHELLGKLAEFRASGVFTDFTIKVRGKEFKVHKCILAAQSSVFREIFKSESVEASKTFTNIKNFSSKAFECFLDFFYSSGIDDTVTLELFELASEFDVQKLKAKCVARISNTMDESKALEVFNLGHQHKSDELKKSAFKVLQKMFPDLKDSFEHNSEKVNNFVALKRQMEELLIE